MRLEQLSGQGFTEITFVISLQDAYAPQRCGRGEDCHEKAYGGRAAG